MGPLEGFTGGKRKWDKTYVILNIYCFLQTDLGVILNPGGELVSVQVAEILAQKATENKSLSVEKKISDLEAVSLCYQLQELRLHASGHGDKS